MIAAIETFASSHYKHGSRAKQIDLTWSERSRPIAQGQAVTEKLATNPIKTKNLGGYAFGIRLSPAVLLHLVAISFLSATRSGGAARFRRVPHCDEHSDGQMTVK